MLFISHSSQDNDAAIRVCEWLRSQGWEEIFLDLDPIQGLAPGQYWQQELKRAGDQCSGVLILISPAWAASRWCQIEFFVADQLGKKIFPIFIAPTPLESLPPEITGRFQFADLSTPAKEADGFARLAIGLKRAGLDPQSFPWPPPGEPDRPIYRGLESLDEQDAAIFFGRDGLITKGMDTLRRMRDGAPERALIILGASGAGKSSFLKAGLLARLRRDETNFAVLPVVRPGRAALSGTQGLAAAVRSDAATLLKPGGLREAFSCLRAAAAKRLARHADAPDAEKRHKPPTIVVAIDQAEELFAPDHREGALALDLLADELRSGDDIILIAAIRSDAFLRLQEDQSLAQIALCPFSLPPAPIGSFKEIIEKPAQLARPPLTIEPALCERLLQDLAAEDALPLLAFALQRLTARKHAGGTITLSEYLELGGLQGAIVGAVDAALSLARGNPALPDSLAELENLTRALFIPALVDLSDSGGEPHRRVERQSAFTGPMTALLRHFIDQRLLVSSRSVIDGAEVDTVEVAHEAILRQWPLLKSWIAQEQDSLRNLQGLRAAASEWRRHAQHNQAATESWLAHRGLRLAEAEALLRRADFSAVVGAGEREYLAACRTREDTEHENERVAFERRKRLQRRVGAALTVGAVLLLLAGLGMVRLFAGLSAQFTAMLELQAFQASLASNYESAARFAVAAILSGNARDGGVALAAELQGAAHASRALGILQGHRNQVLSAAYSPDGKEIVTASSDRTARVWSASTGKVLSILPVGSAVYGAVFSPDGTRIATASQDGLVRVWDAHGHRVTRTLASGGGAVWSVAFSADGTRLASASGDNIARVWDAHTGRKVVELRGHTDQLESVIFSPDGTRIATASDDKTARLWDAQTGTSLLEFRGHTDAVQSAAFSPDGKQIVTASRDHTARIWDTATGQQVGVLGHDQMVYAAAFSHDGARIVTASKDRTARIWDPRAGTTLTVLRGHSEVVNGAVFSPDDRHVVTASDDGTARVWDVQPGDGVTILRGHRDAVIGAEFSPGGGQVVTGSSDNTIMLWDVATSRVLRVLSGHTDIVESVSFSTDGHRLVSASNDRTARIWDLASGRPLFVLRGHGGPVYSAAFSRDGRFVVTGSTDSTARIWDATSGRSIRVLRGHSLAIGSSVFSPDGRRVLTASSDRTVRLWDAATGALLVTRAVVPQVAAASFSPDGKSIVLACRDWTARVWDANLKDERLILRGHEQDVLSANFSADGRRIVTASHDNTARVWDAETGTSIAALRGHDLGVNAAAFSADGKHVVTASDDNTARIWNVSGMRNLPADVLVRTACRTTLRNGLSRFSESEIRLTPVLNASLDSDACRPASTLTHLLHILWPARSN